MSLFFHEALSEIAVGAFMIFFSMTLLPLQKISALFTCSEKRGWNSKKGENTGSLGQTRIIVRGRVCHHQQPIVW